VKPTAQARALAAQAMAAIVGGTSLRASFAAHAARLDDARDRALLSALLHEGARWWLRYEAAVDGMLSEPLRAREPVVHAALVLGIVQLEVLRLPEYAAVAATVDAIRALGKTRFAALANAVLRRWLRERETQGRRLDEAPTTRRAHPAWLLDVLAADWPQEFDSILTANNIEAPLWLRCNRRRTTPSALRTRLADVGVVSEAVTALPDALLLPQSTEIRTLPGYAEGLFSVQDGAAQHAAGLLDLADGMRVLDACAAPGGKSAHILEFAGVDLLALDANPARLRLVEENLHRLGLHAGVRAGDAAQPEPWWDGRPFERILLDAPCSATGIIRRQPDIKLHRRASDIDALVETQRRLLEALWPLLRAGGRLVYATCSVLARENVAQIEAFLARHADARVLPAVPGWRGASTGAQNLPGESGMDGFFYAVVEKYT
jgi:16S rRNA (cytosine967-C5)-methyltransferase